MDFPDVWQGEEQSSWARARHRQWILLVLGFCLSEVPFSSPAQPPITCCCCLTLVAESCRLAGKVAVITGGASGIGKATAFEFVRNGAKVIIADLGGPDAACYAHCDVSDEAQVAAAVDLAVERHGRLDVMFNNAGIGGDAAAPGPLASLDLGAFDRVMAVNARGALAGVKHAARVMVPRRRGSIVCTASTAGVLGTAGIAAYGVS
ncbi:hypothetical protein HU200_035896 [Digitaria exilis]|uniref:Uncharacterized protein n=1 Tax=Digitaria exilis TaxID=1010633 RepID=A0A835BGU9_9POAL|nr:hypothetical protein HU200_035896 [Digitaria exilis]